MNKKYDRKSKIKPTKATYSRDLDMLGKLRISSSCCLVWEKAH